MIYNINSHKIICMTTYINYSYHWTLSFILSCIDTCQMSMQLSRPSIYPCKKNSTPFFSLSHPTRCCLSTVCVLGTQKQVYTSWFLGIFLFKQLCPLTIAVYAQHMGIMKHYTLQLPTVMHGWNILLQILENFAHFYAHIQKSWENIVWATKSLPALQEWERRQP